jgi:predicted alpha/beta-hydrolase family hydrolase
MPRSSDRTVPTPAGAARVVISSARAPQATLVLGHGASGGIQARDLVALAAVLPPRGITVARVEQPWKVAGRSVATAAAQLDSAWCAVLAHLADAGSLEGRLVVGGRSAGARVACRTAESVGARGAVALAFPLHPPGRPERSRLAELLGARVPTLVVQGERDPFGAPAEFPEGVNLRPVPGADHGFRVAASGVLTQQEALTLVTEAVAAFIGRESFAARGG